MEQTAERFACNCPCHGHFGMALHCVPGCGAAHRSFSYAPFGFGILALLIRTFLRGVSGRFAARKEGLLA